MLQQPDPGNSAGCSPLAAAHCRGGCCSPGCPRGWLSRGLSWLWLLSGAAHGTPPAQRALPPVPLDLAFLGCAASRLEPAPVCCACPHPSFAPQVEPPSFICPDPVPWQGLQGLRPPPALLPAPNRYLTSPVPPSLCALQSADRLPPFLAAPPPRCAPAGFSPLLPAPRTPPIRCLPPPSLRPLQTSPAALTRRQHLSLCTSSASLTATAPLHLRLRAARPPSGTPPSKTILVTPPNTIFYVKAASLLLSPRGAHSPAQHSPPSNTPCVL